MAWGWHAPHDEPNRLLTCPLFLPADLLTRVAITISRVTEKAAQGEQFDLILARAL